MVVLTILDDAGIAFFVTRLLEDWGHAVVCADDPREAARALHRQRFDLILTSRALLANGHPIGPALRAHAAHVPLVTLSDNGTTSAPTDPLIWHELCKPVDPARLREVARLAECHKKTRDEVCLLREELARAQATEAITGLTTSAERLREAVRCAAQSSANVLIRGEPGTGKERLARAIHRSSPTAAGPFVSVRCAHLSPAAFEESVDPRRSSIAQQVQCGALFLDEICDTPLVCQAELLELLARCDRSRTALDQDGGSFRVIASTAQCPQAAVNEGRLRGELLLRVSVLSIHLPALRERPQDLLPFADDLLRTHSLRHGRPRPRLSAGAAAALLSYDWPGNIRELSNVMERVVLLGNGSVIRAEDIPRIGGLDVPAGDASRIAATQGGAEVIVLDAAAWSAMTLDEFNDRVVSPLQRRYVCAMLRAERGSVKSAAERGCIASRTFRRMLRRHAVVPAEYKAAAHPSLSGN